MRCSAALFTALKKMKNKQNKAKFILYMWDSFSNKLHSKDLISYFDKCLTFNREDADNYSMSFRPLFFIDEYNADLVSEKTDCDIDIGFIGFVGWHTVFFMKKKRAISKTTRGADSTVCGPQRRVM